MGLTPATTSAAISNPPITDQPPARGVAAWMGSLPPRDRLVYGMMLGLLGLIVAVYVVAGLQSLSEPTQIAEGQTSTPAPATATAQPSVTPIPASATAAPPTPTALPTSTPSPRPTEEPTKAPVILVPTLRPTSAPTAQPTATSAPATAVPTKTAATAVPTKAPATAQPTKAPATRVPATRVPATSAPATAMPTSEPQPEQPPANLPPTPEPVLAPTAPIIAEPPPAPAGEVSNQYVWLYFSDSSGTLYVPIQRRVAVESKQVARAATLALIEGPRTGLTSLLRADTRLLGIRIADGTAYVNFDRDPSDGDERGYNSLVLTLTHFSTIKRVQVQVGGDDLGGPRARPVVNPLNPLGLPVDYGRTEFLPLYFVAQDGYHHVRVIRMVPKTRQTAEGTVRALLEGPGEYGYALRRVIPDGTDLRGIWIDGGVVSVDFTARFADADERWAAVRTVTESLTTLPGVRGVRFLIEGSSASDYWGAEYGGVFERPLINAE